MIGSHGITWERRRQIVMGLVIILAISLGGALSAPAAPGVVVSGGGTVGYTEQAPPVVVGGGLTVTGGSSYGGQYIEFAAASGDAFDQLSLGTDGTPSTATGVVSIVGTAVYLGNGTTADPIGSVDPTLNGTNGAKLRVNFTSAFSNSSFESGDLTGWTALNQMIDLGVTPLAGVTSVDTSTYPASSGGNDNDVPAYPGNFNTFATTNTASDGSYSLRLESTGMTTRNGCDVVHGPAVWSDPFQAAVGDEIFFDWRAYSGDDAYHVFGYILDQNGNQTEVLDTYSTTSSSTTWATKATTVPATGTYRFVFVSGTFDATCGNAAGAALQIDNVRVFGDSVDDAVVTQIAQRLQYAYTGDNPPASRILDVTAASASAGSDTGTVTVAITGVGDPPALAAPPTPTFTNTEGAQTFPTSTGTLSGSDPEGDALTFAISGAVAGSYDVDGVTYTTSKAGTYGTLYVADDGSFAFVPDAAAIDARLTDDTEGFGVEVRANGQSGTGTLTVAVDVPASVPGPPTDLVAAAGDGSATLTWTPPTWLGGSAIVDYMVEQSTDGGSTWSTVADGSSPDITATVTGLDNGTPVIFRVSATNATGTGPPSLPSTTVTPLRPQDQLTLIASGFTYGDTTNLVTLGGSGKGAVTYTVTDGPCVVTGATLSATGVGSCTLSATRAGDGFYDATTAPDVTITVSPRLLNVFDATVVSKVADGTPTADIEGATLLGVVDGDDVELVGSDHGLFAKIEPGTGIPVLSGMSLGGTDAANYVLVVPSLAGTIEPAPFIEAGPGEDGGEDGETGTTPPSYQPGEAVTTTVCELEPGSEVTASLAGDDAEIGQATVGADGCAEVTTTLPVDVAVGDATLTFTGTNNLGEDVTLVKDVTVYAPVSSTAPRLPATVPARLPATGQSHQERLLLALILFGTGLSLTTFSRQRRWLIPARRR